MLIGFGISPSRVKKTGGAVAFDADAEVFFTAASITDSTQKNAVNQLVLDLKSYNIWTKMKAIYPICGGSASSHAVNLKTPGTYNLTFSTGWTHSSNGIVQNGTGFANTNFNPSTQSTLNNTHLSLYSRTIDVNWLWLDFGNTIPPAQFSIAPGYSNVAYSDSYNYNTGRISSATSDGRGFYLQTRTASNVHKFFRNGVQLSTTNIGASGSFVNLNIYLGALNDSGTAQYRTSRQYAFASIGDGLTDTEASNFRTAVQAYQTTLSRQV